MITTDFPRVSQFVAAAVECDIPASGGAAIGWLRDDDLVAGVFYDDFTGREGSITATIAVAPGAVLTREFCWAIFDYPFKQLGARKVIVWVAGNNWKSLSLANRLGFKEVAVILNYYPDADAIILEMVAHNCKWLEKENGQKES